MPTPRQHGLRRSFRGRATPRTPPSVEPTALALGRAVMRHLGTAGLERVTPELLFGRFLGLSLGLDPGTLPEEWEIDAEDSGDPAKRRRAYRAKLHAVVRDLAAAPRPRRAPEERFDRQVRKVGAELGLCPHDREILRVLVATQLSVELGRLIWSTTGSRPGDLTDLLGGVLGLPVGEVRARLLPTAPLTSTGLIERADPADPTDPRLTVDVRILELCLEDRLTQGAVLARFLSEEPEPQLASEDFRANSGDLDVAMRLLARGLSTRQKALNLLLHGGTGTGKTEMARLLARLVGARLFLAGAAGRQGEPPSGRERLCSASVAQRLLSSSQSILLFDELEDLGSGGWGPWQELDFQGGARPSKLWLNRQLEENVVPTIWTTNSVERLDPALLRRFTFCIGFRPPGPAVRLAVWRRHAGKELPDKELEGLAQGYDVSPGEIGSAVQAAKLAGAGTLDPTALERVLNGAVAVMPGRRRPATRRAGPEYRPEAVNASTDLVTLANKISVWRPSGGVGLSLCLYGRSGTGKSEYVHHLARRTGRQLLVKRPSDIEGKYVGETEKAIARAFAEAEAQEAVLLFDEVDSLLRDRRGAQHQWELGFVNEFLQQLEACRGFVACTTNLFRDLDQAALRRFTFKVEFKAPTPAQLPALFQTHLAPFAPYGSVPPEPVLAEALRRVGQLVPGDFAVVARKAAVLGGVWSVDALLAELEGEARARGEERAVGF